MSETLRDLVVSLSLNSDNFTRNVKSINKQIQEAESAFRLASAGVENFETTTAGLSSKLSTLQRTFQLQQDAVGQYERALQQASDKLQECYTRQNDYAQRLTDAKDKQQQLKTEVASAAQAYKHYKNTLGETDSATIAAKANLDAYKGEYRTAVQEVKGLPVDERRAGRDRVYWHGQNLFQQVWRSRMPGQICQRHVQLRQEQGLRLGYHGHAARGARHCTAL